MARARFARPTGGARRSRPGTDWGRFITSTPIAVAAGAKVLIASFVNNNPGIAETVRRTRGRFAIMASVTTIADNIAALGMMVVSDSAAAAGAASIPGPVTDRNDDGWFVWESAMCHQSGSGTTGAFNRVVEFDSKAMRRVLDGYQIAVMVENGSPTVSIDVWLAISTLASRS